MNETLPFAQAVAGSDAEIDLAAAALLIAEREYPGLDVDRYRARLDDLAARARARGGDVEAVRHVLFADEGFAGNTGDYYDARNSFLNDVLDRRVGIPITLSVIFLEVAWRLGLAAEGIGYPGHFLVRVEGAILDCFNGGVALDPATLSGPLPRADKRTILARMLANLARIAPARGWVAEMAAVLDGPRRARGPAS